MKNRKRPWKDPDNEYFEKIPYFQFFLDTYSESSKVHVYHKIKHFHDYCRTHFDKGPLEVTGREILHYFKDFVNVKPIQKKSKLLYRDILSAYYNYISDYKRDIENIEFKSPIPSRKIWDFSGKTKSLDFILNNDQELTIEIIEQVLHHIYFVKPMRIFIATSLMAYTGARINEIASIELKKIDLNNRWFIVQVKSKKSDKRDGIYYFPEFFVSELNHYIKLVKEEYPDAIYLFHSEKSRMDHYYPRVFEHTLKQVKKELNLNVNIHPHVFRDFLNTKRFDMGCKLELRKLLLNQTVKDVNVKHYLKSYQNKEKLRTVFDKYNPFTELIKPNPRL